ncbi:MAG: Glycoprotein gp2 [Parcubacteria group bacterium GW2011_GWB1_56_8]|nr:MAG: Glycoprotein gp2 [Parcubacteria group bacterium GW2011_GWB1_56_8]
MGISRTLGIVQADGFIGPNLTDGASDSESSGATAKKGQVFYLCNATVLPPGGKSGSDSNDGSSPLTPFATLSAAHTACVTNRGDTVYMMNGHAETFSTAAAVTLSKAGVTYIGMGSGDDKPTFTFDSLTGASLVISGNNTSFKNVIGLAGIDALTKPFDVTGDDCDIDIEWRDASATVEAATCLRLDTANDCNVWLVYKGFTAGNAVTSSVIIDDCDNANVFIEAYGVCSTAWVDCQDAASTNVNVRGLFYTSGVTDLSRNFVDTITGSTWSFQGFDASAGQSCSGSSGSAIAGDDVSAINAKIGTITNTGGTATIGAVLGDFANTTLLSKLNVPTADAVTNVDVADVVGNKTDAAIADTIEGGAATTQSIVADVKAVLQRLGADSANNTAATTLVAANRDGSVLERLEQLEATVQKTISKVMTTPSGGADALFTITGGSIRVVSIWGVVTTVLVGAANGTLQATTTDPAGTTAMSTTVAIDNDAKGTSYTFVGPTGVLTPTEPGLTIIDMGSTTLTETQYTVPIGNINFLTSAAQTGEITWCMTYKPSPAAVVVAA